MMRKQFLWDAAETSPLARPHEPSLQDFLSDTVSTTAVNPYLHRQTCPTPRSSSLGRSSCASLSQAVGQKSSSFSFRPFSGWKGSSCVQMLFYTIKEKLSEKAKTHLSGQSFLGHHFECVDDRNVAEPPGDGQSAVPVLEQNGER